MHESNVKEAGHWLLIISGSAEFLTRARIEFERRPNPLSITTVDGIEGARRALELHSPAAILLEETAVGSDATANNGRKPTLWATVTSLAEHAPVVVIGSPEHQPELTDLLASGIADYISLSDCSLTVAVGMVERRLRQKTLRPRPPSTAPPRDNHLQEFRILPADNRDFGEILRHGLNNPLTGILGNAELLLTELRRDQIILPPNVNTRLETIAALAVRMRETVRQLSEEWETYTEKSKREMAARQS